MNKFHKKLIKFLEEHRLVRYVVCLICSIEAETRFITDKEMCEFLDGCHNKTLETLENGESLDDLFEKETPIDTRIPKNTYYCEDCEFKSTSKLARWIWGTGSYCLYLQRGDFSFSQPTDLLWDGVKCCGINQGIPDNAIYEDFEEC